MEIRLRQWYFSDKESFLHVMNNCDRSYTDYSFTWLSKCDDDQAISRIRRFVDMLYDGYGYAQAIEVDGKVAGHVQVIRRNDLYGINCDFDIVLLPEYCGKGIGTWVLKRIAALAVEGPLNYDGLYASFFEGNLAARGMCEKAGLQYVDVIDAGMISRKINGEPCRELVYAIQRPQPEVPQQGVCLMQWERRYIDYLARLFDTVDGRYDDIVHPLAEYRIGNRIMTCSKEEIAMMGEEKRRRDMLDRMRDYVDDWKEGEERGEGIYRAIINDGSIVGLISLTPQEGKRSIDAELGCMLMPEHCGKGVATQAVRLMLEEGFRLRPKLHRVSAWVYAPNVASRRVLEKNGFHAEGIQREAVMCEGHPTDRLLYGLLRKHHIL